MSDSKSAGAGGLGCLGAILGAALSYAKWHSVGWAILHFVLGWVYVAYFIVRYGIAQWGIAPILP